MTMNPRSPHSRQYKSLLAASLSLLSLVGLLAPSSARADITVTVDKGQDSSQKGASTPSASSSSASGSSSGGYGGKSKGGGGGSGGKAVTGDSSSTFFTITLRNTLNTPVKGVEVEYHIYNKTTVIATGPATNTVDDITDKITVDLDGGGTKQIQTKDIPHVVTVTTSSGSGGGGGGKGKGGKGGGASASSTSSSVQDVMGWVIYLNFKGKPKVRTFTSSDTIVDQVAKYMNPNGTSGGSN